MAVETAAAAALAAASEAGNASALFTLQLYMTHKQLDSSIAGQFRQLDSWTVYVVEYQQSVSFVVCGFGCF